MSSKLRVLFLSLAVVLFTAVSAFAVFTSEDIETFVVSDQTNMPATTEGYNYYQRVYVDVWPQSEDPRVVSWEIYPSYEWLNYNINGNEVVFSGVLPAYDARMTRVKNGDNPYRDGDDVNNYTIHVVAHLDCDVPQGNILTVPGHISADVDIDTEMNTSGLIIGVESDTTQRGLFEDMVEIDASAVESRDEVSKDYSVSINFRQDWATDFVDAEDPETGDFLWEAERSTDLYVFAELECGISGDSYVISDDDAINLPHWLDYEVTEIQYNVSRNYADTAENPSLEYVESVDPTPYAKTLRIFFKEDSRPKNGEKGTVRVVVTPSSIPPDDDPTSKSFDDIYSDGTTIAWNVTYVGPDIPDPIILIPTAATVNVEIGSSDAATFTYSDADVSGDPTFPPGIAGLTFTTKVIPADSIPPSGKITVTVAASDEAQEGSRDIHMTVTDVNGKTETATITVNVTAPVLPFVVTPESASVSVELGSSIDVSFTAENNVGLVEWRIGGTANGLRIAESATPHMTQYNTTGLFTITGEADGTEGVQNVAITAVDEAGNTFTVNLDVLLFSGNVSVNPSISTALVIKSDHNGGTGTITLNSGNAYGNVHWEVIDYPQKFTITPLEFTGDSATFTINAPEFDEGNYTAQIRVTDGYGRSTVYNLSWTSQLADLLLSGDFSPNPVTVEHGYSAETGIIFTNMGYPFGVSPDVYIPYGGWTISPDSVFEAFSIDVSGMATEELIGLHGGHLKVTFTPKLKEVKTYNAVFTLYNYPDNFTSSASRDITIIAEEAHMKLSGDFAPNPVTVEWGKSADVEIAFYDAIPRPGSFWTMYPDISSDVSFDVNWTLANNGGVNGKFTVTATPITPASADYTTTFRFYDSNDNVVSADLTVKVRLHDLEISPVATRLDTITVGQSRDVSFNVAYNVGLVTWSVDVPAEVLVTRKTLLDAAQYDTVATYSFTGKSAGTYNATITATDSIGRSVDAIVTVPVIENIVIAASGDEVPDSLVVTQGGYAEYTFVANNADDNTEWTVTGNFGNMISTLSGVGKSFPITIHAESSDATGTYTATITARGSYGRTAAYTLTWTVEPHIVLESEDVTISVVYGSSADIEVGYTVQNPASIKFATDLSADVKLSADWTPANSATPSGIITITAQPVTPVIKLYSTDIFVTDEGGYRAAMTLYISVDMKPIAVTPESASVSVITGRAVDVSFTVENASGVASWNIGTVPAGVKVEPSNTPHMTQYHITELLTVTGITAGTYSVDITATDEAGRSDTGTLVITVTSEDMRITPPTASVTVTRGGSAETVRFTASNNGGNVTWSYGTLPAGVTLTPANAASTNNTIAEYAVAATSSATAGNYSVTVTATDSANRTATATLSITVNSHDTPTPLQLTVTPSSQTVAVEVGKSKSVSFTASNATGTVTWSVGTVPAGVTVTGSGGTFTVTGVTVGEYTVTVTATASNGSASARITISVSNGVKELDHRLSLTETTMSKARQALIAKLGSRITSTTEVAELPDSAMGTSGISYVSTTTVNLPEIIVTEAKIYVFGVDVSNLPVGWTLSYSSNATRITTGEYVSTAETDATAIFLDDSGNEITTVPENKHVNVAAYMEPGNIYEPSITATAESESTITGVGESNGGCSAGLGAMVSVLAAAFLVSKKRP